MTSDCRPSTMTGENQRPGSLAELVAEFLGQLGQRCDEDTFYATQPSLEAAIQNAAQAITAGGSISTHQRQWVDRGAMAEAGRILLAAKDQLQTVRDFHSLWERITRLLGGIKGLGDLYYYDTSRRIGAYLGLYPTMVYLHRGTREGAKALGLDHRASYLPMIRLPRELRQLEPRYVEDFLCIYKDRLGSTV